MAKSKNNEPEQQAEDVRVAITQDNAVLLLAAAEELGLDPGVVRVEDGEFVVPANVVEKAGAEPVVDEEPPAEETAEAPAENTGE